MTQFLATSGLIQGKHLSFCLDFALVQLVLYTLTPLFCRGVVAKCKHKSVCLVRGLATFGLGYLLAFELKLVLWGYGVVAGGQLLSESVVLGYDYLLVLHEFSHVKPSLRTPVEVG